MPRKLYFDLEYMKESNKGKCENSAMNAFYAHLIWFIKNYLGISTDRGDFLELDSSSADKFSRHVIWSGKNKVYFDNERTLKMFVGQFLLELEEEADHKNGIRVELGEDLSWREMNQEDGVVKEDGDNDANMMVLEQRQIDQVHKD